MSYVVRNRVKEVRTSLEPKVGQKEIAAAANVSRPHYSLIESNKVPEISGVTMLLIAQALGKPVESLFFVDPVMHTQQKTNIL